MSEAAGVTRPQPGAFSQRDARWEPERLGESALTIGQAGCLLCVMAGLLAQWGWRGDPRRLNRRLLRYGGYAHGGQMRFGALEPLGARLTALVDCYRSPANLRRIAGHLEAGRGVAALIDARPGREVQAHWVGVLGVDSRPDGTGRDCRIMDPWQAPGEEIGSLVKRYGGPGWGAGRAIFMYATFERTRRMPGPPRKRAGGDGPGQGELCVRFVADRRAC